MVVEEIYVGLGGATVIEIKLVIGPVGAIDCSIRRDSGIRQSVDNCLAEVTAYHCGAVAYKGVYLILGSG